MKEADRDYAEAGFASAFVERPGRNVAGEVTAEGGEFVVHPKRKFGAMAPKEESAENKDGVTEARKKTE